MLDPALGEFDFVVAMDSLIHYEGATSRACVGSAQRTRPAILFTVAPRTPALTLMHAVGRLFPRGDRAPAIAPISERGLARLDEHPEARDWRVVAFEPIARGFYISQAMEVADMNRASAALVKDS